MTPHASRERQKLSVRVTKYSEEVTVVEKTQQVQLPLLKRTSSAATLLRSLKHVPVTPGHGENRTYNQLLSHSRRGGCKNISNGNFNVFFTIKDRLNIASPVRGWASRVISPIRYLNFRMMRLVSRLLCSFSLKPAPTCVQI